MILLGMTGASSRTASRSWTVPVVVERLARDRERVAGQLEDLGALDHAVADEPVVGVARDPHAPAPSPPRTVRAWRRRRRRSGGATPARMQPVVHGVDDGQPRGDDHVLVHADRRPAALARRRSGSARG